MIQKIFFRLFTLLFFPIFSFAYNTTSTTCVSIFLKNGTVVDANLLQVLDYEVRYKDCDDGELGEVIILKKDRIDKIVFDENFAKKTFKFTKNITIPNNNVAIIGKNASITLAKIQKIRVDSVFYFDVENNKMGKIARKDIFFMQFSNIEIEHIPKKNEPVTSDSCVNIVLKNGQIIQANLLSLNNKEVRYKACDDLLGDVRSIEKSRIKKIIFNAESDAKLQLPSKKLITIPEGCVGLLNKNNTLTMVKIKKVKKDSIVFQKQKDITLYKIARSDVSSFLLEDIDTHEYKEVENLLIKLNILLGIGSLVPTLSQYLLSSWLFLQLFVVLIVPLVCGILGLYLMSQSQGDFNNKQLYKVGFWTLIGISSAILLLGLIVIALLL